MGAVARVNSIVPSAGTVHAAEFTATGAPPTVARKSDAVTVVQSMGSLKVATTTGLPPVALIESNAGSVRSTVTVRTTLAVAPALSVTRNSRVWDPSVRVAPGVNVQVTLPDVSHPVQRTPASEKVPVSTFTSTLSTTPSGSAAVPP